MAIAKGKVDCAAFLTVLLVFAAGTTDSVFAGPWIHRAEAGQRGPVEFKVAVITDIHDATDKLASCVTWINDNCVNEDIKVVMVLGDIANRANTTEWYAAINELDKGLRRFVWVI